MIPTIKDWFYSEMGYKHGEHEERVRLLIDMHVKAALQQAAKNARILIGENNEENIRLESKVIAWAKTLNGEHYSASIDKHSITNAYPVTNIK